MLIFFLSLTEVLYSSPVFRGSPLLARQLEQALAVNREKIKVEQGSFVFT